MQRNGTERSIGELVSDLMRDMSSLVRQEVNLATTELTNKATRVGRDAVMLVAGGLVAYAGFLVLLGALVLGLALFIPLWLSALIVALVVLGIGYVLVQRGLSDMRQVDVTPRQTVRTVRENVEFVKGRVG